MSPLNVEIYNPTAKDWVKTGEVKPGDPPGSISDNKPDKTRDLFLFECAPDDSKSVIYKSEVGADIDTGKLRIVLSDRSRWTVIKELHNGESYEIRVKTDVSPQPRKIRFTHL